MATEFLIEGYNMKRTVFAVIILLVTVFTLNGCNHDKNIPNGYINKEEYFDKNGFQDYTDYCKYYYSDKTPFEKDSSYQKVTESDIDNIKGYFSNFEEAMKAGERINEYDFDDNCITSGDYVKIITKEGTQSSNAVYGKYDNYNVYFFDVDSGILYYIHTNI